MPITSSGSVASIVRRTLNFVDMRLVNHGERVAYLVMRMMGVEGGYDAQTIRNIFLAACFHDIGAYKTEEIDRMVQFETGNVWEHSVYGYLFVKYLTPLADYAPVILLHHTDFQKLQTIEAPLKRFAQMVNLADRIDVYLQAEKREGLSGFLQDQREVKFDPALVDLFWETEKQCHVLEALSSGAYLADTMAMLNGSLFTEDEIMAYLKMLVYVIDFRSRHTVTHTITTAGVGQKTGELIGLDKAGIKDVVDGCLLHDLGKIAIPVEILEYPGKLSPQAMQIMRTHVDITGQILGEDVRPEVLRIALRHHEKLDGSGYPLGLREEDLAVKERLVAVTDIVSALSGTRSYKDAFPKEKTLFLIGDMAAKGLLDKEIVSVITTHYDEIMEHVREISRPVMELYEEISREYSVILSKCIRL